MREIHTLYTEKRIILLPKTKHYDLVFIVIILL